MGIRSKYSNIHPIHRNRGRNTDSIAYFEKQIGRCKNILIKRVMDRLNSSFILIPIPIVIGTRYAILLNLSCEFFSRPYLLLITLLINGSCLNWSIPLFSSVLSVFSSIYFFNFSVYFFTNFFTLLPFPVFILTR